MTAESAYCERIGGECNLKRQAIATRDLHTLTSDTLNDHNAFVTTLLGRAARALSRILPFNGTIEEIPTGGIDARRERYNQHIAQPCEGEECAMNNGLEKL